MLLRSFSFNREIITDKELSLFEYLVEHPEYKCDVAYDILMNAFEGRIDYSKEFNLVGYEAVVKKNIRLGIHSKAKKEYSYDVPISSDSDNTGVDLLQEPKDFVAEILDNNLYNEAVDFILNNKVYEINTTGSIYIDLKVSLLKALRGIPEAVQNIKLACDTDNKLKSYIEVLLTKGIDNDLKKRLGGSYYGNC